MLNSQICLQIPCLCGSAPCLLCRCCPSGNNSTVTRLIYALFLLLGVAVACVMLMPGMEDQLKKVGTPPAPAPAPPCPCPKAGPLTWWPFLCSSKKLWG